MSPLLWWTLEIGGEVVMLVGLIAGIRWLLKGDTRET